MGTNDYVFISYSHGDFITDFISKLTDAGYSTVFDESISYGEEWDLKVRRQISNQRCRGLLLFMSEKSVKSNAILTEIEYAERYGKPYTAVVLSDRLPEDIFKEAFASENENEAFVARSIAEFFPVNKLYIKKEEFDFNNCRKLKQTFREWGFSPDKTQIADYVASTYSSEISGEKERLEWQARGYVDFDASAIKRAIERTGKDELTVLDIGCSNGHVTYSRFSPFKCVKKVIGVDYNENDLVVAREKYKDDDRFSFYNVDLNEGALVSNLKEILKNNSVEGVDIIFASFIMQHVKEPKILLLKLYEVLAPQGQIIIRESDDGSKVGYPDDKLAEEIISRTNKIIKSSDRDFGRKLYPYLNELGYENVEMMYSISDTIGKTRREKEWMFTMYFSFRLNRIKSILAENPENEFLQKEVEWLEGALSRLRVSFFSRGYYYSARAYIAIGSV